MVWDAWHKFPKVYSGDSRRGCLEIGELLPKGNKPGAKFSLKDSKLLEAAEWWHTFRVELVPRATRDRSGLVQEWLVYHAVESVNVEDVATHRTVQVLKLEEPGDRLPLRPSFNFIRIVRKWHEAFRLSRIEAWDILKSAIFSSAHYQDHYAGEEASPLKLIPEHVRLAQYHACGMLLQDELSSFMGYRFRQLTDAQRLVYVKTYNKNLRGRGKHGRLLCWVAENVPVFEAYGYHAIDVLSAAERRGFILPVPKSSKETEADAFCKLLHERRLGLRLKVGPTEMKTPPSVKKSEALLTQAPCVDLLPNQVGVPD